MKIGCCVNMVSEDAYAIGYERLPMLKEFGFDYAELPLAQLCAVEKPVLGEIKAMLRDLDLNCETCNNFIPASVRITGAEADPSRVDEYVRRAMDVMAEVGASTVVFGSSGAKNVPEGFPRDKAYGQIVDTLQRVSRIIEPYGVTAAIEPINRLESNIILTAAEGKKLAEDVNCENIRLLVDWYHMAMENEGTGIIGEAKDLLRHVHFAVTAERRFPRAGDDITGILGALKAAGYDRRISIEAYSNDFANDAPAALEYMRKVWAEV